MINRTIRQNIELANGVAEIMTLNPRITKESEVFPYAYHLVATDILTVSESINWDEILLLDFQDRKKNITFSETRSITVDEDDYQIVLDHFSNRPGVKRVQFAYLTRLVLLYTRKKLREIKGKSIQEETEVMIESINGISILHKFLELLENDSQHAKMKVLEIKRIIEER